MFFGKYSIYHYVMMASAIMPLFLLILYIRYKNIETEENNEIINNINLEI